MKFKKQNNLLFILLLLLLQLNIIMAQDSINTLYSSQPTGYVNDYADTIDEDWQNRIELLSQLIDTKSTDQIAVVTISTISPYSIEEVASELFEKWKIGKKGKDNGILILLALQERKVRVEVGYGLEGLFPDSVCGRFIDYYAIPFFKNNEFGKGFYNLVYAFGIDLAKESGSSIETWLNDANMSRATVDNIPQKKPGAIATLIFLGFLGFFIRLIIMGTRYRRGGLYHYGYLGNRSRNNNGGFWGGSGGGFGGFGGGSSGGGGSTRSF